MGKLDYLQLRLTKDGNTELPNHDGDLAVLEAKPKLKPPSRYKVIMLNDDYTPMDFVVETLELFFNMDRERATRVMLMVHTQGKAVCGVYTHDVAETKAAQVNRWSKGHQHPLMCEIEAFEGGDED